MYSITTAADGFICEVRVQDGKESWVDTTFEEAVKNVIIAARVMNGTYITEDEITYHHSQLAECPSPQHTVSEEDAKLLKDIKAGRKKVIDFDDPLIRYNIRSKDCQMIVDIREGKLKVVPVP